MERLGYGPDNGLAVTVSTRNSPEYRDPAVILIGQLREIYIDAQLDTIDTAIWFPKVIRRDYTVGLTVTETALDDPDQLFYENYVCGAERNYTGYCNPQLDQMIDRQSMEALRRFRSFAGRRSNRRVRPKADTAPLCSPQQIPLHSVTCRLHLTYDVIAALSTKLIKQERAGMPFDARVFQIFIASPGDVYEERGIATEVLQRWNDLNAREKSLVLLPLRWETHSSPELGARPQAVINRQVLEQCDLLIGVFWTRLGTPTGESQSGTVEEIERAGKTGKPIMLYFSNAMVNPNTIDLDEYKRLKEFRNKQYPQGLVETYESLTEFRDQE